MGAIRSIEEPTVKAAFCECGKPKLLAVMPDAEIDKDSIKSFTLYAKKGNKISYISLDDARNGGMCICNQQLTLI
jgi:hypothetical protein